MLELTDTIFTQLLDNFKNHGDAHEYYRVVVKFFKGHKNYLVEKVVAQKM